MDNIILIGMPGAGKSTVGVLLAKALGMNFIDSDLLIQEQEKKLLKDIIAQRGLEGYLEVENQVNRDIRTNHSVIATGGSVVYCPEAMEHLGRIGTIVYIKLDFDTINDRLGNIRQRGVVLKEGQSLRELYEERCPLYEKYAHLILDGQGLSMEEVLDRIIALIR
jgi:shikimate kinase